MPQIDAPARLTVREVQEFAGTLRAAVAGPDPVTVNLGGLADCDALGFQLVESARASAAASSVPFNLAGPLQPPLAAMLARLGADRFTHPHWFNEVTA